MNKNPLCSNNVPPSSLSECSAGDFKRFDKMYVHLVSDDENRQIVRLSFDKEGNQLYNYGEVVNTDFGIDIKWNRRESELTDTSVKRELRKMLSK